MKKLLLTLVLFIPIFTNAQPAKITLLDGTEFVANVDIFKKNILYFTHKVDEIKSDFLDVKKVISITGKSPSFRIKAIHKVSPNVIFLNEKIDNSYRSFDQEQHANYQMKSGDLIQKAGKCYLTGFGFTLAGGGIATLGSRNQNNGIITVGCITAITGVIISLTGHLKLIEAGKAMNREALTLSASENRIGLAINF
jgi:hypothetical protein